MRSTQLFGKSNAVMHSGMCLLFFLLVTVMLNSANAAAPQLISYQAMLSNSLGNPLDTTVNVTFKIWDAESGGGTLWAETHTALTISDGKLSVLLGSITVLDESTFSDTALYLGITVGSDAEISPRSRIVSVPYAYRLSTLDGASAGNVSGTLQISEGSSPASLVVVGAGGDSVIIAPSDSFTIRATDPAGNPTFSVSVGSLGTSVSLFDPVDSKDGFKAVPTKRVEITPEGILMFDSTGTDTSVSLTATGDISGSGQIQMGAVPSGALATTVFGVNNNASGDTATISGGANNVASADFATVSGGFADTVSAYAATVAGGYSNKAVGLYAAIGGGWDNYASDLATVGGGWENTADQRATVGGGNSNTASGYGSTVAGGVANKAIATSTTVAGGDHNYAGAHYATVGGGISDTASGFYSTIAGGILNRTSGTYSVIGGGSENYAGAAYSSVFSGYSNLAGDVTADTAAFIGGGRNNRARGKYAVVAGGGGGSLVDSNAANGDYSTVSGGIGNVATQVFATIAGGRYNDATADHAFVGGGWSNNAIAQGTVCVGGNLNQADSQYSTVGGGQNNFTSNAYATIMGGQSNIASGRYSAVGGGVLNLASGNYSFAAGRRARAVNPGSFVWADSINANFSSTAANQFNVRASGGVRIYTNDTLASGVTMGAGANAWSAVSDKSVKKDFRSIDSDELLEKLSEIPISRWKYIAEESQADHIGPMAQDFYSAFGLGDDDKRISTIDADGVALAAIQALYMQNRELKMEIEELRKQIKELVKK